VGASGTIFVAVAVCGLVYVPVFLSGIIDFVRSENGPTPTPFIAATVNEVEVPAESAVMVWKESASTTTCDERTPLR